MLLFYVSELAVSGSEKDEVIKIKFEVDTNPPEGAAFEAKYRLLPVPYEIDLILQSS